MQNLHCINYQRKNMDNNNIPVILQEFRGIDLSRICKVTEATASRWKSGKRIPSRKNLEKILDAAEDNFFILNELVILKIKEKRND